MLTAFRDFIPTDLTSASQHPQPNTLQNCPQKLGTAGAPCRGGVDPAHLGPSHCRVGGPTLHTHCQAARQAVQVTAAYTPEEQCWGTCIPTRQVCHQPSRTFTSADHQSSCSLSLKRKCRLCKCALYALRPSGNDKGPGVKFTFSSNKHLHDGHNWARTFHVNALPARQGGRPFRAGTRDTGGTHKEGPALKPGG